MDVSNIPRALVIPNAAQGLHVLLVDHHRSCLHLMASILEEQSYKVTTTELASIALSLIWEGKCTYDLVIAEVNMPEMNGITFLKQIFLITENIPIILMSSDRDMRMAKRALKEGACFFFWKPIRTQDLTNVWRHVFRKRSEITSNPKLLERKDSRGANDQEVDKSQVQKVGNQENCMAKRNGVKIQEKFNVEGKRSRDENGNGKRRSPWRGKEKKDDDNGNHCSRYKKRLIWTRELHQKFVNAIDRLGEYNLDAHPKEILIEMEMPNLTTRHIASHLQKYRQQVAKFRNEFIKEIPAAFESLMNAEPTPLRLQLTMVTEQTPQFESIMVTNPNPTQCVLQGYNSSLSGHPQIDLSGGSVYYHMDRLKQLFTINLPNTSNDQNGQTTMRNQDQNLSSTDKRGKQFVSDDAATGHFGLRNVDPIIELGRNKLENILNADHNLHQEVDSTANSSHVSDQNLQESPSEPDIGFNIGEEKYSLEDLTEILEDLNGESQEISESASVWMKEPLADNDNYREFDMWGEGQKYSLEEFSDIMGDLNGESQGKSESTSVCPKEPSADTDDDIMELIEKQDFAELSKILADSDDYPFS